MLKIVILDSGYGGEIFADRLEQKLKIAEIIRVIDWRNSEKYLFKKREARKAAETAMLPYLGKVDLIILANFFLSASSLKYFTRKYKNQKFVGLKPTLSCKFVKHDILILATSAMLKTKNYHNYVAKLKNRTLAIPLDTWPAKIDDGELTQSEIDTTLRHALIGKDFKPAEIIIMCSQFSDIKTELRKVFGMTVSVHDSFEDALQNACRTLKLRGGDGEKSRR